MRTMCYEAFVKYGRHWSYKGTIDAESPRGAALMIGYRFGRRVVKVRPEYSQVGFQVFRFGFTPELHHGR